MAKREGSTSETALESCKTSAEILREARAAIRLADSTEQPYTSLDINSNGSDYSEKNSIPEKGSAKKSQSVNVYPSGHSISQISNLQPIVVPAALFRRQQPVKAKNYGKAGTQSPFGTGSVGYTSSPTDGRELSASSQRRTKIEQEIARQEEKVNNFAEERIYEENEKTRTKLMATLACIKPENTDGNEKAVVNLKEIVWENKSLLKHGPLRSEIMKEMFRLMNEFEAEVTINIVAIIFELKPSGKNLTTIFKVLYRLSENPINDKLLAQKDFITSFFSILQELPSSKYPHALMYGYGMLKNLSQNLDFLKTCAQIQAFNSTILKHLSGLTRQLLDVLKYLANYPEIAINIYASEINLVSELCGSMAVCIHDLDITLKTVEILRCVARYEECCESFSKCAFCFPVCVQIVKKYFGHQILVKGICYILGSLAATRKKASLQLYQTPQALDVLLALLHHYVSNERNSAQQYKKYGKSNSFEEGENNSVIYKVLRVLANMSCSDEVGQSLAKHTLCVDLLLDVLNPKIVTLEKQVFLATLTTLSNMAYYLGTSLGPTAALLAEKLHPLLATEDPEILLEVYHSFSNLSHNEEVRILLIKRKIIPLLLNNLEMDYLAIVYYAGGILLNLLVEREGRLQFHEHGGITRSMATIQDLLPDEWSIGALLCQIIWNFAHSQIGQTVDITTQEAEILIRGLEELIDENFVFPENSSKDEEDEDDRRHWEQEFCPLAIELLDFLTSGVAHI